MPSAAIAAIGTLLKMGDGASPTEAFTTIAEVRDISGPALSADTSDVTAHDGSGWAEIVPTVLNGGEVTFDINYVPTNATHGASSGLLDELKTKTKRNFQLIFTLGPTTWAFSGYVTAFRPAAPVRGQLAASVTVMITGQPTLV